MEVIEVIVPEEIPLEQMERVRAYMLHYWFDLWRGVDYYDWAIGNYCRLSALSTRDTVFEPLANAVQANIHCEGYFSEVVRTRTVKVGDLFAQLKMENAVSVEIFGMKGCGKDLNEDMVRAYYKRLRFV